MIPLEDRLQAFFERLHLHGSPTFVATIILLEIVFVVVVVVGLYFELSK
jgi:predicted nucleic-acid-binding protein